MINIDLERFQSNRREMYRFWLEKLCSNEVQNRFSLGYAGDFWFRIWEAHGRAPELKLHFLINTNLKGIMKVRTVTSSPDEYGCGLSADRTPLSAWGVIASQDGDDWLAAVDAELTRAEEAVRQRVFWLRRWRSRINWAMALGEVGLPWYRFIGQEEKLQPVMHLGIAA